MLWDAAQQMRQTSPITETNCNTVAGDSKYMYVINIRHYIIFTVLCSTQMMSAENGHISLVAVANRPAQ